MYRHFPLSRAHPAANIAASVSEYAAESMDFFKFSHSIMSVKPAPTDLDGVLAIAKANGLDVDKLTTRLADKDDKVYKRVTGDLNAAQQLGVQGTPTFFVRVEKSTEKPGVASSGQIFEMLEEPRYKNVWNGK